MFTKEASFIQNETLRNAVMEYMNTSVPSYFFHVGASSTGKHHPKFSQGEGGLVRHTKAVVMILNELLTLEENAAMPQEEKDCAFAAAIVHDTCKYGMGEEMNYDHFAEHAENAARNWEKFCASKSLVFSTCLTKAVRGHMGQWSTNEADKPTTKVDKVVHLADYLASRSFLDIPNL